MAAIPTGHTAHRGEQLAWMWEDARFDVADDACSDTLCIPDLSSIRSRPSAPKVPKVFLSNNCRFNCAYCGCRCSNESRERYCMEPGELAKMAVDGAAESGRGVFVTSAIYRDADYTQELIVETVRSMREELHYPGYIHAKVMPGASPELIARTGEYADRLSINIEVAQSSGYQKIAKQKNRRNILSPMGQISRLIQGARLDKRRFATSQTTQLMAGSTGESDRTILNLSGALYQKYRLKRVYYTAFQYQHRAAGYDLDYTSTPTWRTRRLYQADRLMKLYGFAPEELAPPDQPNLSEYLDPKVQWAIRNMNRFPVEVNRADYETLLRVPGIGIVYAKRILEARKYATLTHEILRQIGVPVKKSLYFIQCNGKYLGGGAADNPERLYPVFREELPGEAAQLTFF